MSDSNVALAKTSRPQLSGIFPRERLFDKLQTGLEKQLTWVTSPAGAGKTSLVADYITSRNLSCLWYRVDERDNDIATFFHYMGLAVSSTFNHSGEMPPFSPHHMPGLSAFTKHYFEALFTIMPSSSVIVFDNYQDAGEAPLLHQVVSDGLEVIPQGIHIVVISRNAPTPDFSRLLANNNLNVIGWEELQFTFDESKALMERRSSVDLPDNVLGCYHKKTDGWAAGLVLALESARTHFFSEKEIAELPAEKIFEYFAAEVLGKLDVDKRNFLLATSVLPDVTTPLAEELTGFKQCGQILRELHNSSFFVTESSRVRDSYNFHPLFRDFLLSEAENTMKKNELSGIKNKAATLLAESGQVEEAVHLFLQEESWEDVVPLILSSVPSMFNQGAIITIQNWLSAIPAEIMESNPWLIFWEGSCAILTDPETGKRCYEKATTLFKQNEDRAGILLTWARFLEFYTLTRTQYDALENHVKWLEDYLGDNPEYPSGEIEIIITGSVLSAFALRLQHYPTIKIWIRRGQKLLEHRMTSTPAIRLGICLFFAYRSILDDRVNAAMIYKKIAPIVSPLSMPPVERVLWHLVEALYAFWIKIDGEKGIQAIDKGLSSGMDIGMHSFDSLLLVHGIRGTFFHCHHNEMARYLKKLKPLLYKLENFDVANYYYMVSLRALTEKNLKQALENAREAERIIHNLKVPVTQSIIYALLALIHHHMGQPDRADHYLDLAEKTETAHNVYELNCLMPAASIALKRGRQDEGLRMLSQALSVAREHEYYIFRCEWPEMIIELCKAALKNNIEVDFVRKLIRIRHLVPEKPPVEIENWPWPVKINTLGSFEITLQEKPLKFTGKVPQKPLALLKSILARGGRQIPQGQLADDLWPDSSGDAAVSSLKKTLQRLRRLLGMDEAVLLQDGHISINDRICWIDIWAFDKLKTDIERRLVQTEKKGAGHSDIEYDNRIIHSGQKLLELYKGGFLSSAVPEPWLLTMQLKLQSNVLRLLLQIGRYLEKIGKSGEAVNWYIHGLGLDNRSEELYQRLMECYNRLGRRAEALIMYEQCVLTLSTAFGVEPSAATTALYKSIKK